MFRSTFLLVVLLFLGVVAPAQAETRTLTLRYGPVHMGGYNVEFPKAAVDAPKLNGYVTYMTASLVDKRGKPITIRDVMLHHLVFHRRGRARSSGPARAGAARRSTEPARRTRTCASRAGTATRSARRTSGASPRC